MNKRLIVGSSLLALALAACGGNPAVSIPQGPSASVTGNLTKDKATAQKASLQSGIKQMATTITSGGALKLATVSSMLPQAAQAYLPASVAGIQPFAAGRVGAQKAVSYSGQCKISGTITYEGDDADVDGDGIVVKSILKLNNCSDTAGKFVNGQFVAQDKNDNDAKSGYLVVLDATSQDGQLAFGVDFSPKGSGVYDLKFGFKAAGANGDFIDYGYTLNYAATDPAKPYDGGTLNATGKFGVKSGDDTFVFNFKGVNLVYSKACGDYVSGSGTYEDSNSNKVEIAYSGCATSKTKHNGTDI